MPHLTPGEMSHLTLFTAADANEVTLNLESTQVCLSELKSMVSVTQSV